MARLPPRSRGSRARIFDLRHAEREQPHGREIAGADQGDRSETLQDTRPHSAAGPNLPAMKDDILSFGHGPDDFCEQMLPAGPRIDLGGLWLATGLRGTGSRVTCRGFRAFRCFHRSLHTWKSRFPQEVGICNAELGVAKTKPGKTVNPGKLSGDPTNEVVIYLAVGILRPAQDQGDGAILHGLIEMLFEALAD